MWREFTARITAFPVPNVTMTYTGPSALEDTANPVTIRNSAEGCSGSPEIRSPAGFELIAFPTSLITKALCLIKDNSIIMTYSICPEPQDEDFFVEHYQSILEPRRIDYWQISSAWAAGWLQRDRKSAIRRKSAQRKPSPHHRVLQQPLCSRLK